MKKGGARWKGKEDPEPKSVLRPNRTGKNRSFPWGGRERRSRGVFSRRVAVSFDGFRFDPGPLEGLPASSSISPGVMRKPRPSTVEQTFHGDVDLAPMRNGPGVDGKGESSGCWASSRVEMALHILRAFEAPPFFSALKVAAVRV